MRLDVSGLPVGSEQTRQAGLVVGGGLRNESHEVVVVVVAFEL